MKGSCLCGGVTISVPGRPDYLNACNCAFCLKLGALWGYYPRSEVRISGERRTYVREDLPDPHLSGDSCVRCGSTINWAPLSADAPDRMGVNMRLFDLAELRGVELRFGDWRNHPRAEPRRYYREPTTFDGLGATE